MKRSPTTLSQAIDGYLLAVAAERLSPHTIADYSNAFRKLQTFLGGDPPLSAIKANDIRSFLADLETPRAPAGTARRPSRSLAKKTVLNIHTGLSALWTWAVEEGLTKTHVLHAVDAPKPERRAIVPLTQHEVKALLAGCERSRAYERPGK